MNHESWRRNFCHGTMWLKLFRFKFSMRKSRSIQTSQSMTDWFSLLSLWTAVEPHIHMIQTQPKRKRTHYRNVLTIETYSLSKRKRKNDRQLYIPKHHTKRTPVSIAQNFFLPTHISNKNWQTKKVWNPWINNKKTTAFQYDAYCPLANRTCCGGCH